MIGRGFLMGGADIIPGVSGGTVALILGIYERLVTAISHFDTTLVSQVRHGRWRDAAAHVDLRFLVSLGLGIGLGIGGLATLMNYLLEHQLQPTLAVFFGLILASSFLVARQIERWSPGNIFTAIGGAAFAFWLVAQPFMGGYEGYPYLFLCGMVAICAMILPGISGAFILLILGRYAYVTGVVRGLVHGEVTTEHLLVFLVFGSGCAVGLLGFSKILRWLLAHFHATTMSVLCGFMIGSLRRIWPFKATPAEGAIDLKHAQLENVWPDPTSGGFWLAVGLAIGSIIFVVLLHAIAGHQTIGQVTVKKKETALPAEEEAE